MSMRAYIGNGHSFMNGFNASVQMNSFFNRAAFARHRNFLNLGVNGQSITPGTSTPFNLTTIRAKTTNDERLIVAWDLNDTREIYDLGTITLVQFETAVQAFFGALAAKGWSKTADLTWITGYKILDNAFYTIAEYQTVVDALVAKCISNGVHYITNFPTYPLDPDGVHPKNDTAYEIMGKYVQLNMR